MALCPWCAKPVPADARRDSRYCRKACRQAAFRLRRRRTTEAIVSRPMRFAYADPPYPSKAYRYRDEPTYAGEVDHEQLVRRLEAGGYDGWALSTSSEALRAVLPICPERVRVCAWGKPQPADVRTHGIHRLWEAVLVVDGRQLPPGVPDWLSAKPARGGDETLIGRKPLAFAAWLFDLLGMQPGDTLDELYPGTGLIGRAWAELSSRASSDASIRRCSSIVAKERAS